MNRNTIKKRLKYWHIGMIFYVLIFFSGIGIMANVLNARATRSLEITPLDTPIVTLTPPITPIPTPPPPTPTPTPPPTPTPTPPPAQPTIPPAQPTRNVVAPPPMPTDTLATPTITITATATATATAILPTSVPPVQNTTHTQLSNPSVGNHAGGPNVLVLSLGISTSGILLFGGGLLWLYSRRNRQGVVALQQGKTSGLNTNTLWTNNWNGAASMGVPPASGTGTFAADPHMYSSPYVNSPLFSSNMDMASGANMPQQSIFSSPAELPGPVYTPSAFYPMTAAFPQEIPGQQASGLTPYTPASDMKPLSFDAFALPQDNTIPMPPEQFSSQLMPENPAPVRDMNSPSFDTLALPQDSTISMPPEQFSSQLMPENPAPVRDMNSPSFDAFALPQDSTISMPPEQFSSQPIPENLVPPGEMDPSTVTPPPNISLSTATARLPLQLPDVADDRTLQEIMRQAQVGLFILSE